VTLSKFNPKALNYQILFHTSNGKGIILIPNGAILDNSTGSDITLAPAGTLKVGTAWSGTITLPMPRDFTGLGEAPNTGNAFQATVDWIELR
jgi:hypothetical protein